MQKHHKTFQYNSLSHNSMSFEKQQCIMSIKSAHPTFSSIFTSLHYVFRPFVTLSASVVIKLWRSWAKKYLLPRFCCEAAENSQGCHKNEFKSLKWKWANGGRSVEYSTLYYSLILYTYTYRVSFLFLLRKSRKGDLVSK